MDTKFNIDDQVNIIVDTNTDNIQDKYQVLDGVIIGIFKELDNQISYKIGLPIDHTMNLGKNMLDINELNVFTLNDDTIHSRIQELKEEYLNEIKQQEEDKYTQAQRKANLLMVQMEFDDYFVCDLDDTIKESIKTFLTDCIYREKIQVNISQTKNANINKLLRIGMV